MMPPEKMEKTWPHNTICQIIRTIYQKTDDEEIKILCRIATLMAKKMDAKLRVYNNAYDENQFWEKEK